ncbi:zinc ribbon domain-containing protein [Pseudobutyrivibrio ruminis]|uniref:Zinc-ribbon domain-containing protein n=1 Tax=Pseudobutyrivibrio ruminis DSM 9787 TaxID=1123011 RepID=A0A285T519_9FIRM|nr:zinc ribbon domain-containing protein [Pseudobutyrivibrio ruminis]SOC16461.1 zinc-ribbon domain-containing protein [Pseudobutyrivibrio ruminis DSM 9787]
MPLPVIMLMGAAAAGTAGAANGVKGAQKMYESNKDKKMIEAQHAVNTQFYEKTFEVATKAMDELGEFEIMIMSEFQDFSDVIEKIENRPKFGEIKDKDFKLPEYSADEIQKAAVGAIALASGIGGAALGTFGGFAAAGATTAAVAAVGTASTGTAIASLSGAAATNATLAALGGGSLAAGGGGIALGTTVLGAATLGVGLMIGGVIFNISGNTLKQKMEEAKENIEKETTEVDEVCLYLQELYRAAENYKNALAVVKTIYDKHFARLQYTVEVEGTVDYRKFSDTDKLAYKNTVLLVGILYDMLKAKLVEKKDENYNQVNQALLNDKLGAAHDFLSSDKLIKKDMLGVLEHHVEDQLVNEKLPEKEIAVVEENELTKNVKDLSGKVGKSVSETATKVSKLIKPGTCPSCGAKLDKGAKFCNKCGTEVNN